MAHEPLEAESHEAVVLAGTDWLRTNDAADAAMDTTQALRLLRRIECIDGLCISTGPERDGQRGLDYINLDRLRHEKMNIQPRPFRIPLAVSKLAARGIIG